MEASRSWISRVYNFATGWMSSEDKTGGNRSMTALHLAIIASGNPNTSKIVKLLTQGYDVNARASDGSTPLHFLMLCDRPESQIIELLIHMVANGADVNAKDDDGLSILFAAVVAKRSTDVLELLLSYGADWKDVKDNQGLSILHIAAKEYNLAALKLFLSLGIEVDSKNLDELTPLTWAVAKNTDNVGLLEIIKILVENGADINAKYGNGRNILFLAVCMGRNKDVLSQMVDYGATWKNFKDDSGISIIHAACSMQNLQALQYFISLGAWTNEPDNDGLTPLLTTAASDMSDEDFWDYVTLLVENGADIEEKDKHGNSVLFTAVLSRQNTSKLELLLQLGAVWNEKNKDEKGILELAVLGDNLEAFKLFIEMGADIHAKAADGKSVFNPDLLSKAEENGPEMCIILRQKGVDTESAVTFYFNR